MRYLFAWIALIAFGIWIVRPRDPETLEREHVEPSKCPNYKRLEDDTVLGCDRPDGHPGACRSSWETGARPIPRRET